MQFLNLQKKSFTLVEFLVYIAIFVLIFGLVISFIVWSIQLNAKSRASRETLDSAQQALRLMIDEIKQAERVYFPTSLFDSHPGQLSLETTRNLPSDESLTYADFYLDNEKLYLKREGVSPISLTPDSLRVSSLVFTLLKSPLNPNAPASVKINLEVEYNTPSTKPQWQSKTSFLSAASTLRR